MKILSDRFRLRTKIKNSFCIAVSYLLIFFFLSACQTSISADEQLPNNIRDIGELLEEKMKQQNLPAVAAAVISHDKIVAIVSAGVKRLGRSERVHINDRWHLGSCTKSFTATMIGILVEQGRLSWDTTIAEVLPDLLDVMHPDYLEVTIEMLLSNRGGIPHEWDVPGLWDRLWKREGTPVEERRKMAEVMLSQPPRVQPGQYFYSNCGFGIAGHMAEVIMDKSWEHLVGELVFDPLDMKTAGFGVPWRGVPPTDPWPHKQDGTPVTPGRFADNPPSIGPAGTIHASIGDWALYIIEHLRGARGENGRLLSAKTYQRLHQGELIDIRGEDEYALGWMVVYRSWAKGVSSSDNGRCLNHGGSNNSWYALVWLAPERDFAVIATTNIGGEEIFPKIDAVIWAVIRDHLSRM